MRLILPTLLLAFAVFFTSIKRSTQSTSESSQGSTGRGSRGQREDSGARPSYSVVSGKSAESGSSRPSGTPRLRQPLRSSLEHSSRGHSGSRHSNSGHSGSVQQHLHSVQAVQLAELERSRGSGRRRHLESQPEEGQQATSRYTGPTTRLQQSLRSDQEHSSRGHSDARHSCSAGPRQSNSAHSSLAPLNPGNPGTSRSAESSRRQFPRLRSPVHERHQDTPRPVGIPPIQSSPDQSPLGQFPRSQYSPGQPSHVHHQQEQVSNSAHQSESSRDSTNYSFQPSSSNTSFSVPQSPHGPFSFQYDSPSETSESSSSNHHG